MPQSPPSDAAGGAETESNAYRDAIRSFADVTGALGDIRELDDLLHLIASKICELVGVSRCSVYLREKRTGLYTGRIGHAGHNIDAGIKRLTAGVAADGFTREIVESRAPVVVHNARSDSRLIRSTIRRWNVRSIMGVPLVLRGEVTGVMFVDDEDRQHTFTQDDQDIASAFADLAAVAISQAQLTRELRETASTAARKNEVLRRVAALDERLTSLLLEGRNLHEIVEAVADITGKPCSIHDADYDCLAVSTPRAATDDLVPRLFDPDVRAQPAVAEALTALRRNRSVIVGPILAAGLQHRYLVAPVMVRDERLATLVVMEHHGRFGELDVLIGRRAATIIALELSAGRRAAAAEANARSSLVTELIRGGRDTADVERRAAVLGVDLSGEHVLCLFAAREGAAAPTLEATVEAIVAETAELTGKADGERVLATTVAEGVAVIVGIPEGDDAAVARLVEGAAARIDPQGQVLVGLSTRCQGVGVYARAYEQACQVVRCADLFGPPGPAQVLSADDLGAAGLFLAGLDRAEVGRFVGESLGPLLDDRHEELIATLTTFFDEGRSIRGTGVRLGVHENTIRYRLGRIERLTGLDVRVDADAQLVAHLALVVLRTAGRIPPPVLDAS